MLKTKTISKRLLALFLVLALVNLAVLPNVTRNAQAGTLTSASLTISDSRASNASTTYDLAFTLSVTDQVKEWRVVFCTTASGACTTPTGMTTTGATRASDNFQGTGRTDTFTGNGTLITTITTPATESTQAKTVSYTGITNQSTTNSSFYARITTYSDTGSTVIDGPTSVAGATLTTTSIAVTATVDSTFTFTVAGVNSGGAVNGATTDITTGAATVPFGTLSNADPNIGAHDLTVSTNANSGYTVTVKATADPPLVDGSKNIDKFSGTNGTPTTWSSPAGTSPSVNSGFFGYTTNDSSLGTGSVDRFTSSGGNKWAGPTTSPLEVMYNAGSTSGAGDTARVGWQAEVNTYQPNGSYSGTVILVATPTF